ncbi:MAG: glycosyltransferase family 4 protein [Dehalococcoidia bacterium]
MSAPARPKAEPIPFRRGRTSVNTIRVAFVMEQVVGHAVQAEHMQRCIVDHAEIEARFIPVTFFNKRGLVERLPLPGYARAAYRARLEVGDGLRDWQPDAIFWNTQKPAMFCSQLVQKVPSVISLDVTPKQYDDLAEEYGHAPDRPGAIASAKHWLNRRIFNQARLLLPATDWVRRSLIDDYGVPDERIEVLAPGTDLERFHPPDSRPSKDTGRLRILFVGGDFARKGGDTLLEWFGSSSAAERCELHIVTREPITSSERVIVHRLSHEKNRLAQLFREADIFVLPTRAECFGLVLTEAMASGLPVVTCPVGGIPEVVDDGISGVLVPPGDVGSLDAVLTRLIEDRPMRLRLADNGRAIAEQRFDARKNVARVAEILHEIAEKNP